MTTRLDPVTIRWRSEQEDYGRFQDVWLAWRSDPGFRELWIRSLREIPFAAYCWECPPVSEQTRSHPFECVFISSPSLARMSPEPEAFADYFRPQCRVASFENLGGDALLVAPGPAGPGLDYRHLAAFARDAPDSQQHALWQAVGEAMEARVGDRPVWLSTAGHGIGWLHVRLDSRPKYYQHGPYKKA